MRSWPEISFRYPNNEVYQKQKGKVNLLPGRTDSGGAINFARCSRVLRRLDSCPGEKSVINMSTIQNSSTASRNCNTQEPSWAEDFIDLSEFCQPSTIPTKMEDSADERVTSPISSTVQNHGFDYTLEGNEGLDNYTEDNLWCIPSPIAMQGELCDPISDWLAASKETNNNNNNNNNNNSNNNNNDNRTSHTETSYDINETFLSTRLTSVPDIRHYNRKSTNFSIDDALTPPLQPDTTFFHNESVLDNRNNSSSSLAENVMLNKSESSMRLPPANSLFKEKTQSTAFRLPSHNQFLDRITEIPPLKRIPVNTNASPPCSVQSPSITQSNINQEEKSQTVNLPLRDNTKLKIKVAESPGNSSCTINAPEVLQPFVSKNSEFDLLSYVFEDNKSSLPFDISSIHAGMSAGIGDKVAGANTKGNTNSQPITIKTEPKEEPNPNLDDASSNDTIYPKRKYDKDEDDYEKMKRLRRYSNCSSEDLTQLESEKYRELRNKNNEASRRSRANRKNREVEMREHADKLESENGRLKVKAEEMEKLVKRLRSCLMQLVLKRR